MVAFVFTFRFVFTCVLVLHVYLHWHLHFYLYLHLHIHLLYSLIILICLLLIFVLNTCIDTGETLAASNCPSRPLEYHQIEAVMLVTEVHWPLWEDDALLCFRSSGLGG